MLGWRYGLLLASLLDVCFLAACEEEVRPPATNLDGKAEPGPADIQPMLTPDSTRADEPGQSGPAANDSQHAAPNTDEGNVSVDETTGTTGTTPVTSGSAGYTSSTSPMLTSEMAGAAASGSADFTSTETAESVSRAFDGGFGEAGVQTGLSGS